MPGRPAYAVNWIPSLQAVGLSANAALRQLREQGLGIRRQTFLRAWGEVAAQRAVRPSILTVNPTSLPLAEHISTMSTVRATGYLYDNEVALRDRQTGEITLTRAGHTSDTLISYDEALRGAVDALSGVQQRQRGSPRGQIIGALPLGATLLVPAEWEEEEL